METYIEFVDYCYGFYGPDGIYGKDFGVAMDYHAVAAAALLVSRRPDFEGDSFDREKVRALLEGSTRCGGGY
jgi:hypothetical protein